MTATAEDPSPADAYFLTDVAKVLGVDYESAVRFREVSVAEGGAGPYGLPEPDGEIPGRGRYQTRPWWHPETIHWYAEATGRRNPYTGEPQRLPQAVAQHPRRPTVPAPDPAQFRRLVNASTRWHLPDVALKSGYRVETVKRKFRHVSLVEGGMGPVGMPLPDGYRQPYNAGHRPIPWWRAGSARWWLIATGRMSPYTGEPLRRRAEPGESAADEA
jgi:hypothetical protein